MRIHLLAPPHIQTTAAYYLDGFAQRTILFAELLKRLGHTVILYGSEENDAPCDTWVNVIPKAEQEQLRGPETPYQTASYEAHTPIAMMFNARAIPHIRSTKRPGDIIATITGSAQQQIAAAHPELLFLEYSVGYQGVTQWAHRVYQSHAWRHIVYGFTGVTGGRDFDGVIPPWFHTSQFPYTARPDPYVVYCGRLVHSKGIITACEAAERAGVPLIVMGHGDPALVTYGQYVGTPTNEERNLLLSNATACLMPTQYVEPFGNVAAEAQLCGTPVISTDFGAFTESVEQGVTGYRCSTLGGFVSAIKAAPALDRAYIRIRAQRLYSFESGLAQYQAYFNRLETLWHDGWRSLTAERFHDADQIQPASQPLQEVYA